VTEVRGLTKRYGSTVAVDRLSFDVPPGAVTGFLGLNGSGKSATMRMILGLDSPDAGHARIGGQPYRRLRWPLREAGGLLEPRAFHPGRSARAHLAALAAGNAIVQSRVDEVLRSSESSSPAARSSASRTSPSGPTCRFTSSATHSAPRGRPACPAWRPAGCRHEAGSDCSPATPPPPCSSAG
jgi:ABC-type multidrug transport system ATPase subunit